MRLNKQLRQFSRQSSFVQIPEHSGPVTGVPSPRNRPVKPIIMKSTMTALLPGFCLAMTLLTTPLPAGATLGEPADSVVSNRKALAATRHVARSGTGYTVQELTTDVGVVRQFVSPAGIVFAITWNGLSHPDLTPLLGSYLGEYQQALQLPSGRNGKRHTQVTATGVVVEKWGHMRNLRGRAYVPALVPTGVNINELK